MIYPVEWLKEFVNFKISAEELAELLSLKSFEASVKNLDGQDCLEIEVLPNRGDSLSIIGLAREISAILKIPFQEKLFNKLNGKENKINEFISVDIEDYLLCPRYMAGYIKGVKIKPSSEKIQRRLASSGIRPINNVVDVTNYILLERGQPLHAFDASKINGGKIIVRCAKEKEKITTLDGVTRNLKEGMLVIADKNEPIAIAGVMGGAGSEVTEKTTDILLESAYFNPISIRKTSFALGLRTEASIRFEKRVDFENVEKSLIEALNLIKIEAGGEVISGIIDNCDKNFYQPKVISLRKRKIKDILGIEISYAEISEILKFLGFQIIQENDQEFLVKIPSWRVGDVEREIDLIEEIIRITGYEKIPVTLPGKTICQIEFPPEEKVKNIIRSYLVFNGFYESYNFSLINQNDINLLNLKENDPLLRTVRIKNPLTEEQTLLVPTLLIGLIKSAVYNQNRQIKEVSLFEINRVFQEVEGSFLEELKVGVFSSYPSVGFLEIKGILENIFEVLKVDGYYFKPGSFSFLHPGKQAEILTTENELLGFLGQIDPAVAKNFDLKSKAVVFEISLEKILKLMPEKKYFKPLPQFPAVFRDIAIIVDSKITAGEVLDLIRKTGGSILESVELFDVYQGSQIPEGTVSLAISLIFRHYERTLKEEEINEILKEIIKNLEQKFSAKLR